MITKKADKTQGLNVSELQKTAQQLQEKLWKYAVEGCGEASVGHAWEEFTFGSNAGVDAEEFSTLFPIWYLYDWLPVLSEEEIDHHSCCGGHHHCSDEEEEDEEHHESGCCGGHHHHYRDEKEEHHESGCCGGHHHCSEKEEESDELLELEEDEDEEFDDEDFFDDDEEEEDRLPPIALVALSDPDFAITDAEQEFIHAVEHSPFSLLFVESQEGDTLVLHDLLCDTKHRVTTLSKLPNPVKGRVIYARVISIQGQEVLYGVAPFSLAEIHKDFLLSMGEECRAEHADFNRLHLFLIENTLRKSFYEVLADESNGEERSQIVPVEWDLDSLLDSDDPHAAQAIEGLIKMFAEEIVQHPFEELGGNTMRELVVTKEGRVAVEQFLKERLVQSNTAITKRHLVEVRVLLGLE